VQIKTTIAKINNDFVADKFLILRKRYVLVNLTKTCEMLQQFLVGCSLFSNLLINQQTFAWFGCFGLLILLNSVVEKT
jgi:hypothetical protein